MSQPLFRTVFFGQNAQAAALLIAGCLTATPGIAESQAVQTRFDYVLSALAYGKVRQGNCGKVVNARPMPDSELSRVVELLRPILKAEDAPKLAGPKLRAFLEAETEQAIKAIQQQVDAMNALNDREKCVFMMGYVGGRYYMAKGTYAAFIGKP